MNIQAVGSKNYFHTFERVIIQNTARIVAVALDAIASLCSFVNQNECRLYFRYKARQVRAIYVVHNTPRLPVVYPRLTSSINVAKRELIIRDEDGKAIREMRDQFIANNPGTLFAKRLEKANCLGAKTKGICFGATIVFIKAYLKRAPKSEQELIEVARQFENGFDAEAAAYGTLQPKLAPLFGNEARLELQDIIETYVQQTDALQVSDPDYGKKMCLLDEQAATQFKARMDEASMRLFTFLNRINVLVGLKIPVEQQEIPHICQDTFDFIIRDTFDVDKMRNQFENLPVGSYFLGLPCDHAIAYIKNDFGSYLFDPNIGLINAGNSPFQMCQSLTNHIYNTPINDLKVIPFTLV